MGRVVKTRWVAVVLTALVALAAFAMVAGAAPVRHPAHRVAQSSRVTHPRRFAAIRLRRHGAELEWRRLHGVSVYVLRESVRRKVGRARIRMVVVRGTHLRPRIGSGHIVSFRVRARAKGAKWSRRVRIRYLARRRPPPAAKVAPSVVTPPAAPAPAPAPVVTPASTDPIAGQQLYVDPNSDAVQAETALASSGQTANAALIAKIASQPFAKWFGDWSYGHGSTAGDVNWWVSAAAAAGSVPVIVAYDLPWRDCGGDSAGGAASPAAYETFIDGMVSGLAGRRAVVIVEPDALAELSCLSAADQATYYQLLTYAVKGLTSDPLASVYLDAGNAGWQAPATMAARLTQADVAQARGFSLNVSNFDTTASETAYGTAIDGLLGNTAHFVIDTSRNGLGPAPAGAWCNPPGRGLGVTPTAVTSTPLADAYLWIKVPGESDGTCNGGPSAGTFWNAYALGLAANAAS